MLSQGQKALGVHQEEAKGTRVPAIPLPVVEWLESRHPDVCPSPDTDHDTFVALAAVVDLVRTVRFFYEKQNK